MPRHDLITVTRSENTSQETRDIRFEIREDFYQLTLPLIAGKASLLVGGKLEIAGDIYPGMMRLAAPSEQIRNIILSPTEAAVVRIPGHRFRSLIHAISPDHRPGNVSLIDSIIDPNPQVAQIGNLLNSSRTFDPIHDQLFVDGITQALLAHLLSNHQRLRFGAPRELVPSALTKRQISTCIDFADASMADGLQLDDWAAIIGLSGPDFVRRFRRTMDCSPYVWFMHRRVDQAKHLLQDPNLSLSEIGLRLGFSSQSHFTDAFRRRVGIAPGKWRHYNAMKL